MVKLYCLSGLGVDSRAFYMIKPAGIKLVHVDWIEPLPNETLESYAERLLTKMDPEDGYNLLGLSFGGMLAQEMAKRKKPGRLFMLSTISSSSDLRILYRIMAVFGIHKIIPGRTFVNPNFFVYYIFGAKTREQKHFFKTINKEADPHYLKWAIGAVLNWKNNDPPAATKIHGTKDRLFPLRWKVEYPVKGGTHFMVVDRAEEISRILEKELT